MRVTNSMLVNNFMRNLNNNMNKMDKLQNQLASGRKYAHISDDPIALIYGQAARNKIARLEHYQRTVGSAQDWLRQVEGGVMELQGRVADIYEQVINVATDVKAGGDKNNIAFLIAQLRDHYVDTLNTTFGDKYVYAGYNTPGDSKTGRITGPYTIDEEWNIFYNGYNMSDYLRLTVDGDNVLPSMASGIFGGLKLNINDENISATIGTAISAINTLTPQIDSLNDDIKGINETLSGIRNSMTGINSVIERLDSEMMDLPDNFPNLDSMRQEKEDKLNELADLQQAEHEQEAALAAKQKERGELLNELAEYVTTDAPEYDSFDRVTLSIGGRALLETDQTDNVHILDVDAASLSALPDKLDMLKTLQKDVLTFDVGPSVSMDVTFNGIDMVLFQTADGTTLNIFNVMHELYKAASSNTPAEELGHFITPLQEAQNHLLTKVAEVGGRTRRLELLEARYEQNAINYEQMKSDAEDVDFAEVIMYQKMAEAVYQAALSSGARIIQPTLMDFLR